MLFQTQMLGQHHTDNIVVCVLHHQLWNWRQKQFDSMLVVLQACNFEQALSKLKQIQAYGLMQLSRFMRSCRLAAVATTHAISM